VLDRILVHPEILGLVDPGALRYLARDREEFVVRHRALPE